MRDNIFILKCCIVAAFVPCLHSVFCDELGKRDYVTERDGYQPSILMYYSCMGKEIPKELDVATGEFYSEPLKQDDPGLAGRAGRAVFNFDETNKLLNEKISLGMYHTHYYSSDGYNVGYFPDGIRSLRRTPKTRTPMSTNGKYNNEIIKRAAKCLEDSGEWLPELTSDQKKKLEGSIMIKFHYDLTTHNCQHFAVALQKKYQEIEAIIDVYGQRMRCDRQYRNEKAQIPKLPFDKRRIQMSNEEVDELYNKAFKNFCENLNKVDVSKCPLEFQNAYNEFREVEVEEFSHGKYFYSEPLREKLLEKRQKLMNIFKQYGMPYTSRIESYF